METTLLHSRRRLFSSLAALFATGAWPGALAAEEAGSGVKPVRFVAINDLHHDDAACDPWMEALFRQVAETEGAAFCLGLGDLANRGTLSSLQAVRRISALAGMPFHPCPGNHDLDEAKDGALYERVFPGRRNHLVRANGWVFVILDTTEGNKSSRTTISKTTLDWLDAALPTIDPLAPLVLCTHFPLAIEHRMCPLNAESVLARLIGHNLRGVFGGHFHGRTTHARGALDLRTCACVARVRDNHDGAPEKGYFVVDGDARGALDVKFVRFDGV